MATTAPGPGAVPKRRDEVVMSSDSQLLKESLALVEPVYEKVTGYFYARLFVENPQVRSMFPLVMDVQRDRLFRALVNLVQGIERPEQLVPFLQQLARDHRKFGVRPEHYDAVGRALIGAVKEYSYGQWTDEVESAWWRTYGIAARTMVDAANAAEGTPAFWNAEVVSHERRTADIAVIQVRPDQPYYYEPGQYVSIESALVPRVWRPYSIANAPRRDGVLELHVRIIGAGWVSGALVRKLKLGDVLKLGPPVGSMVLNRQSNRDIVCVAGSTGLAPMKALLDDLRRWNTTRNVHLFFGARRAEELYDLATLEELAAGHPWFTLVPAVSGDPGYLGEQGMLPEVVARHGTWYAHDVYASGSAEMIQATVAMFRELHVPIERIRYDAFGELERAAARP
jgi:NAD(P)H-flavin reductase/hemoglobin-like flavoprotein